MNEPANEALEEFGKGLMENVRDEVIAFLERLTSGRMADVTSKAFYLRFCTLDSQEAEIAKDLALQAADAAIAQFLYYLEAYDLDLLARDSSGEKHDIVATSDGLVGELYTEDGWVARFSQYPQ